MEKIHAPDLRRRMPLSEWPEIDRELWDAALRPADLLEDGGPRARHAISSNQKVVKAYGRWLAWLAKHDLLDPHCGRDLVSRQSASAHIWKRCAKESRRAHLLIFSRISTRSHG
jgi:hypothetical protein